MLGGEPLGVGRVVQAGDAVTTQAFYDRISATARAMAAVQQHRKPGQDVTGRIPCTKCGAPLRFTVLMNGLSRGHCVAGNCLRWNQ